MKTLKDYQSQPTTEELNEGLEELHDLFLYELLMEDLEEQGGSENE